MNHPKAIKIYHRKASTKAELREALAFALGIEHKQEAEPQTLREQMRTVFDEVYTQHCSLRYSWAVKDYSALKQIQAKMPDIMTIEATDQNLLNAWRYTLEHLPEWYRENGFSLSVINSKLNEIVKQIRSEQTKPTSKNQGTSDSYQQGLLNRLRS